MYNFRYSGSFGRSFRFCHSAVTICFILVVVTKESFGKPVLILVTGKRWCGSNLCQEHHRASTPCHKYFYDKF